jgi:hypothetical protein
MKKSVQHFMTADRRLIEKVNSVRKNWVEAKVL